ncbi:S8 family peptidase [Shouchella lonarensis]|uniref:Serine protease, subtilisin family n=1 Tax=Shouchella lonarensis TaxID=1464122 RepID=A0A1G6IYN5_9BACI|nr:S8 family peptidase [Shouchella lonarensis]SDC11185.1 Serine protease, subtilisin family [Shouchella lonarensis]
MRLKGCLTVLVILFFVQACAPQTGPIEQKGALSMTAEKRKSYVPLAAKNRLMAQDLARTTTLFVSSLSQQLERWGETKDLTLKGDFQLELTRHPYIEGFAMLNQDETPRITAGSLSTIDKAKLTHHNQGQHYSDPYDVNGEKRLLLAKDCEDGRLLIGEVNLSFIQSYLTDVASIADSNGTFFIAGEDPDVQFDTMKDVPDGLKGETVPGLGWNIYVQSKEETKESPFHPSQAVVKLARGIEITTWLADHSQYKLISANDPYFVLQQDGKEVTRIIEDLRQQQDISFAEPNYAFVNQVLTQPENIRPNDEFFKPHQWNLPQIESEEGWAFSNGKNTTIAIIDTGVDPRHPDLRGKLVDGYNAIHDNSDFHDENGHGTHVAGIAAAMTNNVEGIAGVSWESKIMPIKALDADGEGSSYSVARAIYWAVDHGADIINLSLGDYEQANILYEAIQYAYANDIVLISASGNDNDDALMYPAAYPEVITVAAVDENRNRAFFSNYGTHVDVAAPGEHIASTYLDQQYVVLSGTSMAAPHVAGLAALVRSAQPTLTNAEVGELIMKMADSSGRSAHDMYYGFGEINVKETLRSIQD